MDLIEADGPASGAKGRETGIKPTDHNPKGHGLVKSSLSAGHAPGLINPPLQLSSGLSPPCDNCKRCAHLYMYRVRTSFRVLIWHTRDNLGA
jgi:hypothetical protein